MFSLYVKEHNITGLKYLGKTEQDPYKYSGSGKHWKNHLKKHGNNVSTYIIGTYDTLAELRENGLHYSQVWDIVASDNWANLIEETGQGWDSVSGKKIGYETAIRRVAEGTNPFLGPNVNNKKVANGTHPFVGGKFWRGRKHNDETKKKLSLINKGKPAWNKGIPRTVEEKQKIGAASGAARLGKKRGPYKCK